MFEWIKYILAYFGLKRKYNLLILGLDNTGKTTLVRLLTDTASDTPVHDPCPEIELDNIRFTLNDVSVQPHIGVRRVWRDFYPTMDGVIYMVDCAEVERFDEARDDLERTINDESLADIPIAVMFNKIDRLEAVGEEYLVDKLNLSFYRTGKEHKPLSDVSGRPLETFPCSVVKRIGYGYAIKWLAYYVEQRQ